MQIVCTYYICASKKSKQMKSVPTARIILDTRREKKNGLYPVRLRVIFERKPRYYPTGKDLSTDDFERAYGSKRREEFKIMREYLSKIEERAQKAIDSLHPFFSFEAFEAEFNKAKTPPPSGGVEDAYKAAIAALEGGGRIGTAESFGSALASLTKFRSGLHFKDITPDFLRSYERWMIEQGRSLTTVGIYLRTLRTSVIEAKIKDYPFGKEPLYVIPEGANIKKALSRGEIGKIVAYQPENEREARARDFWVFSYLCNGMNPKDIAELRFKDFDTGAQKLTFIRAKTIRKNRDKQKVEVYLQPEAVEILEQYASVVRRPDAFLFPILTAGSSAKKQDNDIKNFVKSINTPMRAIAAKLGIDKPVTTYVARHSYATMMKNSGAPMAFISESLGHQDQRTTKNYLDSFEDTAKRKHGRALLDFTEIEE